MIAFALPFLLALTLAQPVSAADPVSDPEGDVPWFWSNEDGSPMTNQMNSRPPLIQVGYLDMASYSLSLEGDYYRFYMSVYTALPVEGVEIPSGITICEWAMWIDPEPWNPVLNPVTSLFLIELLYDGSEYNAYLVDFDSEAREMIPLESHDQSGSELWIEFPADVVNDLDLGTLWWSATTRVWWGTGVYACRFVDISNWDPDTLSYEMPWPTD